VKPGIYATLRDEPVLCIKLPPEQRLKLYHAFWMEKSEGESNELEISAHGVVRPDLIAKTLFEEVQPTPGDAGEILLKLDNRELSVLVQVVYGSDFDGLLAEFSEAMRPIERVPVMKSKGANWEERRKEVLEDYDCECVNCGVSEEEHIKRKDTSLHVHHIIPFKRFNRVENANRSENLIPLCSSCHKALESRDPENVSQIS